MGIVAIFIVLTGIFCIIKSNNFLLPPLTTSQFGSSEVKRYGKRKAIIIMRVFGIVTLIMGILFLLSIIGVI